MKKYTIFLTLVAAMVLTSWSNISEKKKKTTPIEIEVSDETVMQRSFLMHKDVKRTHCISVGTTSKVNYSFDLANGSLLQVWDGKFLDVTKMWHGRGNEQLGAPIGTPIVFHGDPDFCFLEKENMQWLDSISNNTTLKQLGYELDQNGNPMFQMHLNNALITNSFIPSTKEKALDRIISTNSEVEMYHKMGEGSVIEKLSKNIFSIDNKNYVVEFSGKRGLKPFIRKNAGKDELLVKIPSGSQNFSYTISW